MRVDKLVEFLDSVEGYYPLIEVSDCIAWYSNETEVQWVDKNDCYYGEIVEGLVEDEDYVMVNLDLNQGFWVTYVFSQKNRLPEDDFYDKYEDLM